MNLLIRKGIQYLRLYSFQLMYFIKIKDKIFSDKKWVMYPHYKDKKGLWDKELNLVLGGDLKPKGWFLGSYLLVSYLVC